MRLGGVGGGPGVGSLAPAPGRGLGTARTCAGTGRGGGPDLIPDGLPIRYVRVEGPEFQRPPRSLSNRALFKNLHLL